MGSVELPEQKGISKIISSFSPKIAKLADGSITYVKQSSIDYTNKPYLEVLFSLSNRDIKLSKKIYSDSNKKNNKKTKVFFSGALNDINGLKSLINIIINSPENFQFIICGDGEYKEQLIKLSKEINDKLIFLGLISHEECIKYQHLADYLILIRNNDDEYGKYHSKYSMSSKIFEYLLSGTPIIVNDHQALQSELRPFINILPSSNPKKFVEFFEKHNKPNKKMKNLSVEGREYVIKNATDNIQAKKIYSFLNKVGEIENEKTKN